MVAASLGWYYGTVCTARVVTNYYSVCVEYGNNVSGLILAAGIVIAILGLLIMGVRGEFAGFPEGRPGTLGASEPATALCPVCQQPLAWVAAQASWFCSRCGEYR